MVIYYLQSEKDTDSYLATISAFFVVSGTFSTVVKAANGFVTLNVVFGILVGAVFMFLGTLLGRQTRKKINPLLIKKSVYAVMALSGIVNMITALT